MKWIEVKVVTTPAASEAVSGILYEMGVNGLYIEDPRDVLEKDSKPADWDYLEDELKNVDPNRVIIRAYFSEDTNYEEKLIFLREKLSNVRKYFDIGEGTVEVLEVYEKDWANNWKKYYKPIKIGNRVVIKPSWEQYHPSEDDEVIIEIDPGMAFGTGTHETTRLCIEIIEKYIFEGSHVLDIGCGSGILGITALKLGASKCTGVDIDENAVKVARKNAYANGVQDKMDIRNGNLLDVVQGKYDIIVANIIADAIITLSSIIKPYINEGGLFIASGIIKDRYEEVKQCLLKEGFILREEMFLGEWVAVAVGIG
ncbi:MAG: 50S ribosomal protein L11 methyltransferase [Clostridiaceae bacterium]|nr:50S ribosomal protein L11 methyltransferase [Clostridiaceae bacterium]